MPVPWVIASADTTMNEVKLIAQSVRPASFHNFISSLRFQNRLPSFLAAIFHAKYDEPWMNKRSDLAKKEEGAPAQIKPISFDVLVGL